MQKIDARKAYEAIARIINARNDSVNVTLKQIRRNDEQRKAG